MRTALEKSKRGQPTERTLFVLDCIHRLMARYLRPPTIREIGRSAEISSTSVVVWHLRQLEKAGLIERSSEIARSAIPTDTAVLRYGRPATVRTADGELVSGELVAAA